MAGQALAMLPWFPRDFLAATRHWHLYERAVYRELLDAQWELGSLPDDELRLCRMLGLSAKEFGPLWAVVRHKFVPAAGGGLVNKRLEEHRARALEQREMKARGARIVNAKRYAQRPAERPAEPVVSETPPSPSPSPTASLRSATPQTPQGGASAAPTAGQGSTGNGVDIEALAAGLGTDPEDVQAVFDHWRQTWEHPKAALDAKRLKLIRQRLKDYSAADLCRAISGYRNSPHHVGRNDKGVVYDALELFLRDAQHVDAGLRFAESPPRAELSALTRRNVAAVEDWVPPEVRNAAG